MREQTLILNFLPVLLSSFWRVSSLISSLYVCARCEIVFRNPLYHMVSWVFVCLYIFNCCSTCVITSLRQVANSLSNTSHKLTSAWCRKEGHIRFRWLHTCAVDFSYHFNYISHSPETGWLTTSALAEFRRRSAVFPHRLYVCFSYHFSVLSPS